MSNRDAKVIRIPFKPFSDSKAKEASILGDIKAGYTYKNFSGIEEFYYEPKQSFKATVIDCLNALWKLIVEYSYPIIEILFVIGLLAILMSHE